MARIVLLGNGRAPYCSERDYEWTLKSLGHEVVFLQETEATGEKVLEESLKSDALFWIHTWGWITPGMTMKEVLPKLKQAGIPSFAYHLDMMTLPERLEEIKISGYDHVEHFFIVEQDFADYMNARDDLGTGYYLQAGVVERDCFIAKSEDKYKYDVIFSGSYDYGHDWPYRRQLLDFLRATYGNKYHRFGRPYKDQPDAKYIMGAELNKVYASAKIVIGDTLCPDFTKPYYFSNRAFEVTGKGGFLIHPYIKGIEDCFELGKEIVTYEFGNFQELEKLIQYYIFHPEERKAIQAAGHVRTKRFHTFTNRLKTMLAVVLTKCDHDWTYGAEVKICTKCRAQEYI